MIHVAEEVEDVPYLNRTRVQTLLMPDGSTRQIEVRRPGFSNGFFKIDSPFIGVALGIKSSTAEKARPKAALIRAADIVDTARAMLPKRCGLCMLCDDPMCEAPVWIPNA